MKGGVVCQGEFYNGQLVKGVQRVDKIGQLYDGEMKNGQPHGKGKLVKRNEGYIYNGEFKDGSEEGQGSMKDDNLGVAYYKGEFKFGKPNGEGHMKWTDNPRMYVQDGA